MLPPKLLRKFAVTNPMGVDGAMYSTQTGSIFWAWFVWRVLQRGKGRVISAATGNILLPYRRPFIKN